MLSILTSFHSKLPENSSSPNRELLWINQIDLHGETKSAYARSIGAAHNRAVNCLFALSTLGEKSNITLLAAMLVNISLFLTVFITLILFIIFIIINSLT